MQGEWYIVDRMLGQTVPPSFQAADPLVCKDGWSMEGRKEALMVLEGDWGFITLNSEQAASSSSF